MHAFRNTRWHLLCGVVALTACDAAPDAASGVDLPATALARPMPGCTLVHVSAAEPLAAAPAGGDAPAGPVRARMRHEADCVPDATPPAAGFTAYRLHFEQDFTRTQMQPGGVWRWVAGQTRYVDEATPKRRQVDAATEGQGKNCAVLLAALRTRAVPCLAARDAHAATQLAQALAAFQAQQAFPMNVSGAQHLEAIRLGRDTECLQHWQRVQAQLGGALQQCAVR